MRGENCELHCDKQMSTGCEDVNLIEVRLSLSAPWLSLCPARQMHVGEDSHLPRKTRPRAVFPTSSALLLGQACSYVAAFERAHCAAGTYLPDFC